jgi:transmembrane protein
MTPAPIAGLLARPAIWVFARVLLTLPFWWSGIAKLLDPASALGEARAFGLIPPLPFAVAVIVVQLVGSALLILGRGAWLGAGALGIFTCLATLIGHRFWIVADPIARFHERNIFLEHIGLIGGLIVTAAFVERVRRE